MAAGSMLLPPFIRLQWQFWGDPVVAPGFAVAPGAGLLTVEPFCAEPLKVDPGVLF